MTKKQTVVSLVINCVVALVTTAVVISYFIIKSDIVDNGFESFMFFTTDSNVLAAAAAIVAAVFDAQILKGKRDRLPHAVEVFKMVSTAAVIVTFCTVVFFLVPIYGAERELLGTAFHMHVGAPLMSLISFVFFEKSSRIRLPESLLGIIPVLLYGAVYFFEVVLIGKSNGGWYDFYAFNQGGNWLITVVIMLSSTYALSLLITVLHNIGIKNNSDKEK